MTTSRSLTTAANSVFLVHPTKKKKQKKKPYAGLQTEFIIVTMTFVKAKLQAMLLHHSEVKVVVIVFIVSKDVNFIR